MTVRNETTITAEPSTQNVLITRVINAPRERVFQAYTDPELFAQWMGPRYLKMNLKEFDATPGGRWSYTQADPEGTEYGFHGVFHEVTENERIVQTFEFEGMPGHVSLQVLELADVDGGTRITANAIFQNVEDRDGMVQSGMESGVNDGYERLEELLGAK